MVANPEHTCRFRMAYSWGGPRDRKAEANSSTRKGKQGKIMWCYSLNICVSPNTFPEILTPNVMVLRRGAFG